MTDSLPTRGQRSGGYPFTGVVGFYCHYTVGQPDVTHG